MKYIYIYIDYSRQDHVYSQTYVSWLVMEVSMPGVEARRGGVRGELRIERETGLRGAAEGGCPSHELRRSLAYVSSLGTCEELA